MSSYTPAQTGYSRVFLIEGRARPDHEPSYESCLKAGAPSRSFGDVTSIECPDPNEWGKWVEVGRVRGGTERATLPLSGRYAADVKSALLRLARQGCPVDVQIHLGQCTDPKVFETFTKAVVLEDALLTNWEAEDLGALSSGDASKVDETSEISARDLYEVLPLVFAERGGDIVTNHVNDVVICDAVACGECGAESNGCEKIYAVTDAAGGSPSTPADLVYSLDHAVTWQAEDIGAWSNTVNALGVACVGAYVVAIGDSITYPMAYTTKADINGIVPSTWANIATGFVAGSLGNAIWSWGSGAFIAADNGYIYKCSDPTAGVDVADAGVATTADLYDVHGLDEMFAVCVGNAGAIVKTEDGDTWTEVVPINVNWVATDLRAVWVKSKTHWLVGSIGGRLYYTLDGGETFYEIGFPGSGSGSVKDIKFSTASVGYLLHQTAATKGRILRTINGGYTWTVCPEGVGTLPLADAFNAVAVCSADPNFIVAGGIADNSTDGILIVGQA